LPEKGLRAASWPTAADIIVADRSRFGYYTRVRMYISYPIRSERMLLISVPYTTHKLWWHTQIYLRVQLKNFKLTCAKALINSIHCGWDTGAVQLGRTS
jgi:hypothetical protein